MASHVGTVDVCVSPGYLDHLLQIWYEMETSQMQLDGRGAPINQGIKILFSLQFSTVDWVDLAKISMY